MDAIWRWFDEEPSLRVGIVTGEGRAFCAGADLKGGFQRWNSPEWSKCGPLSGARGVKAVRKHIKEWEGGG